MPLVTGRYRKPNLLLGVVLGMGAAAITSIVAVILFAVSPSGEFGRLGISLGSAVALYWAAGIIGGAVFGLILPLATWRWGAVLVGMAAMAPLYIGVAILLGHRDLYSGIVAAVLVGGTTGYGLWSPVKHES